jgi:lincosamide nucleotidyltransferase A/C/D/E
MTAEDLLEVLETLTSIGVDVSIEGGWGVDALVGGQSRKHADVDLAIARAKCDDALAALAGLGYAVDDSAQPGPPARLALVDRRGRKVDLHPLVFDDDGNGWQQLAPAGGWLLHSARYLWHEGRVEGRRVACIAPEQQLAFHLGYVWTDRDRHDLGLLHERFGIPLPPGEHDA